MLSERPWKVETVPVLLAGIFLCISLSSVLLQLFAPGGLMQQPEERRFLMFVLSTFSFQGLSLILMTIFLVINKCSFAAAFGFANGRMLKTLGFALGTFVVALPITWGLGRLICMLMQSVSHEPPQLQQSVQLMQSRPDTLETAFMGVSTILIAPVVEEMLFRGLLYHTIKRIGFPRIALWGTTLLFAAIHSNLLTFLPLFVLAVALTLLYEATDNLLSCILAHSLFNAANFVTLLYQSEFERWLTRILH